MATQLQLMRDISATALALFRCALPVLVNVTGLSVAGTLHFGADDVVLVFRVEAGLMDCLAIFRSTRYMESVVVHAVYIKPRWY